MAGDTEDLVLSISADVRQMQRALDRLVGDTTKRTKQIEQSFDGIGATGTDGFNKLAASGGRAFTVIEGGAKRVTTAVAASKVQTANLAAQLNDIGVQLAGGQSPFQIALQQGTQITQALGETGAKGAVGALAGAFTSMLNPVSLATIAIIALGGTAVQYFASVLSDGAKSEETLKQQADLIAAVAQQWGDAVPALKAYVDELDRAKASADLIKASDTLASQQWDVARSQVSDLNVELAALVQDLRLAGAEDETIIKLQTAWNAVSSSVQSGEENTQAMKDVQDALASAISQTGIPALDAFSGAFGNLAQTIAGAAAQAAVFRQQAIQALTTGKNGPALGSLSPVFSENGKIFTQDQFVPGGDVPTPGANPARDLSVTSADIYGTGKKSRSGGGGKSAADRQAESVKKLIEQLEFEQQTLGQTDQQRDVSNALRRAGAAATDEQKARISELVTAIDAEKDALQRNKDAMRELESIGKNVLGGFISDLRQGKSASDALASALDKVVDKMLDSALDSLFSGGLFGAGIGGKGGGLLGGFLIPGILHAGGVAGADGYGHGRAVSPSVFAGAKRYHTGTSSAGGPALRAGEVPAILERGEVVLPKGTKVGGQQVHVTVGVDVDESGNLLPFVKSVSDAGISDAAPRIATAANRQVVPTVANYQANVAGRDYRNG